MINVRKIILATAMAGVVAVSAGAVTNTAYAAEGKEIFRKSCKACHDVNFKKNRVGPNLAGITGKTVGGAKGYRYSKAMKQAAADGMVWSDENLDKFFTKPKGFMKKTKMSFRGIKKEADRTALIEYLKTK